MDRQRALTPGVMVCDNTMVRLDAENGPQPDILLRIDADKGGQSRINEDNYIEGVLKLAVEIAASSAFYDLHDKKHACRRNDVQEYIVWHASNQSVTWFSLQASQYVALAADESNILRSQIFPDPWLDVIALVMGDLFQVL